MKNGSTSFAGTVIPWRWRANTGDTSVSLARLCYCLPQHLDSRTRHYAPSLADAWTVHSKCRGPNSARVSSTSSLRSLLGGSWRLRARPSHSQPQNAGSRVDDRMRSPHASAWKRRPFSVHCCQPSCPGSSGANWRVRWQPASAFRQQLLDAIRFSDTTLALSIADVCGKGMPAALVMSSLQASVRAFAVTDATPRSVVSRLNQALCRNVDLRRFVTLFYGVYDSTTRCLTYSNAGHNPPAIVRADGSVVRLAVGGMVVGIIDVATYEQGEVQLDPGGSPGAIYGWHHRGGIIRGPRLWRQ